MSDKCRSSAASSANRCSSNRVAHTYHSRGETMPAEITMPQLSDTMTEGKVVKWHKKEGDKVSAGEEIADVETDKAVMPMEAFESGTLAVIAVAEGQSAPVGAVLGVIATGKENAADVKKNFKPGTTAAPAAGSS